MLQNEVAVEQYSFNLSKKAVIAVQIAPAGLHYADFRICEVVNGAEEEIGGRDEIGVEDGDEFSGRRLQPFLQGAGLETFAVGPMDVFDGVADIAVTLAERRSEFARLVRGIVQHLDLQQLARIFDFDDFIDQSFEYVPLV